MSFTTFVTQLMCRMTTLLYVSAGTDAEGKNTKNRYTNPCVNYATIKEVSAGVLLVLCGGEQRIKHAYTTTSTSVEISITKHDQDITDTPQFVIRYQGRFIVVVHR